MKALMEKDHKAQSYVYSKKDGIVVKGSKAHNILTDSIKDIRNLYISGPYTAKTFDDIDINISKARKTAVTCMKKGWYPRTPHLNTAHFEIYEDELKEVNYDYWLKGAISLLLTCDAILMMKDWKDSKGAKIEHKIAESLYIPIFYEENGIPFSTEVRGQDDTECIKVIVDRINKLRLDIEADNGQL